MLVKVVVILFCLVIWSIFAISSPENLKNIVNIGPYFVSITNNSRYLSNTSDINTFHDFISKELKEMDSFTDGEALDAIDRFFWGSTGGIVLEIGSLDGQIMSQSKKLLPLGWNRVLIEGSPLFKDRLKSNSNDAFSFIAVVCPDGKNVSFLHSRGNGGVVDIMSNQFLRMHNVNGLSSEDVKKLPNIIREECISMASIFRSIYKISKINHIHFFILDVESAEMEVLQTIDWNLISFDILVIETEESYRSHHFKSKFINFMKSKNYSHVMDKGRNSWFKSKNFNPNPNPLYKSLEMFEGRSFISENFINRNMSRGGDCRNQDYYRFDFDAFSVAEKPEYDTESDSEAFDAIELFYWKTCPGIVLDIGALDGVISSQSYPLLNLGWKRILVEGSTLLGSRLKTNSPDALSFANVVCDYNQRISFKHHKDYGGILDYMTKLQISTFHQDLEAYSNYSDHPLVSIKRCVPLRYILKVVKDRYFISHIDLLLLDLEGSELSVLRSIDWMDVTIDLIVVEVEKSFRPNSYAIQVKKFLVSRNYYIVMKKGRNIWFARKGFKYHTKPGRIMHEKRYNYDNLPLYYNISIEKSTKSQDVPRNAFIDQSSKNYNKLIPRIIWIASCRGMSSSLKENIDKIKSQSPNWKVNVMNCHQQREFMVRYFNNTSLLWSFDIINDRLQAAKSDIWRIAVLYIYGGVYIDTDAYITSSLDDLINIDDKLIMAFESVRYVNQYNDWFRLSGLEDVNVKQYPCVNRSSVYDENTNTCIGQFYSHKLNTIVKGTDYKSADYILVQWMLFSQPGHPFLHAILMNIVEMIQKEFICNSVINSTKIPFDFPMQNLFLVTGPWAVTASIRKLIKENNSNLNQLRVVDNFYFNQLGAKHTTRKTYFRHMRIGRQRLLKGYINNCIDD